MNKWMKNGMIGLAMTSATVAVSASASSATKEAAPQMSEEVMVDALDFAGGSKLKDRMIKMAASAQQLEIVLIDIQA